MVFNSWVELVSECPINLDRLHRYAQDFESKISIRISINNLNKSKTILLDARGDLDMMFTSLIQLFRNKTEIEEKKEKSVFEHLKDNFARFLGFLDTKEGDLMIKFDEPREQSSRVGVSRLSAYAKELRKACNSIIYEPLFTATKEYNDLEKKNKEIEFFVYIFFDILQDTMSVVGGEERKPGLKKIQIPQRIRSVLKKRYDPIEGGESKKFEDEEIEDEESEDEEEEIEEDEDVEVD